MPRLIAAPTIIESAGNRPFEALTVVLRGLLRVDLPAFAPDTVHRDA